MAFFHLLLNMPLCTLFLKTFRPIPKLPFLSKILEKIVFIQLTSFINQNDLFEKFQSGFRSHHSTETALVKVTNDLLLTADSGRYSILILLDLSSAFDTVDHNVLLYRLKNVVGVSDVALDWFTSYLTGRSFSIRLGKASSSHTPYVCRVPQGSILGPLLFTIYMLSLGQIIRKHNINFHCYADDTQLYVPLSPGSSNAPCILSCLAEIKTWMSSNFLKLNDSKTEVLLITPLSHNPANTINLLSNLGPLSENIQTEVRNLGVIMDTELSFDTQVTKVLQSCFAQLRQLSKIKSFLSPTDLEKVSHAFISCRLDYCNALYSGLSRRNLQRLQLIQNAAARLLTGSKRNDHITPVLAALHWLPVSFTIDFKILLLVFKALNGQAPAYISDLLSSYEPDRCLRSSSKGLLSVPKARLISKGDRAFAVRAPKLWNSLPLDLRKATSVSSFKSLLKTHFYRLAFPSSIVA